MNPNKLKFLTEKYEKENRNLKFHEEFIALPGLNPVSGKFYSKYDVTSSQEAPAEFVKLVKRCASSTPQDSYDFPPPSINMEYGWFFKTLIPRTSDKRLYFPKTQCEITKNPKSMK